jgi:hypothetical protein
MTRLIHSANKSQSNADVELIKNIVENYISNKRTIIPAIISAKKDYANQVILERCREVDRKGYRTLGIITKPDFLRPGSENEKAWLVLAQNNDLYIGLGWYLLKNCIDDEMALSFEERNTKEQIFFSTGSYRDILNAFTRYNCPSSDTSSRTSLSLEITAHIQSKGTCYVQLVKLRRGSHDSEAVSRCQYLQGG